MKYTFLIMLFIIGFAACKKRSDKTPANPPAYAVPDINIQIQGDTTADKDIYFSSNMSNVQSLTYKWNFGDGATSTDGSPIHIYQVSKKYTVTLIINNDTAYKTSMNVFIKPNYSFNIAGIPIPGDTTLFSLSYPQIPGGSYLWDFGDGTNSIDSAPRHVYAAAGSYNITLSVNNDKANTAQKTVRIYTDPIYTHMVQGMRLWHRFEEMTFPHSYSYNLPDTSVEINYIDPLTIGLGDIEFTYNPDSSSGNVLYFGNFSRGHVSYNYALDTIALAFIWGIHPPDSYTGGHPPETDYYDVWRTP